MSHKACRSQKLIRNAGHGFKSPLFKCAKKLLSPPVKDPSWAQVFPVQTVSLLRRYRASIPNPSLLPYLLLTAAGCWSKEGLGTPLVLRPPINTGCSYVNIAWSAQQRLKNWPPHPPNLWNHVCSNWPSPTELCIPLYLCFLFHYLNKDKKDNLSIFL